LEPIPTTDGLILKHSKPSEDQIEPGVEAIRVEGELDLATVGEFEARVARALDRRRRRIMIDLSGCRFIDSSVLAALIQLRAKSGNSDHPRFAVVAGAQPLRVLRMTGLDQRIPVFETTQDALDGLAPAGGDGDGAG
jgi:anti-sigma B factor antagonist